MKGEMDVMSSEKETVVNVIYVWMVDEDWGSQIMVGYWVHSA